MSNPKLVNDHTPAFFSAAIAFLMATGVWNIANIWLLDISVQERYTIGMGIVCAIISLGIAFTVASGGLGAMPVLAIVGAGTAGEIAVAATAVGLSALGGYVAGSAFTN